MMTDKDSYQEDADELAKVNTQLKRLVTRLSYGVNEYERPLLTLLEDIRAQMQGHVNSERVYEMQTEAGRILGDIHALPENGLVEIPLSLFRQLITAPKFPGAERKQVAELAERAVQAKGSLDPAPWNSLISRLQQVIDQQSGVTEANKDEEVYQQAEKVLLKLLATVEMPEFETSNIVAIKACLKKVNSMSGLVACIEDIYSLLCRHHHADNTNKKNIEEFLVEMRQNLVDMQTLVKGLMNNHNSSYTITSKFGRTLENNIKAMTTHLETAEDLGRLKQDIKQTMQTLSTSLEKFSEDAQHRQYSSHEEMKQVNARMNALEIVSEVLKERLLSERKMAMQDALTGTHNRFAYDERIEDELERYQRYESPFVLLVLDLDHFKRINDEYGHLAGDKVLQSTAELIESCIRRVDFLARYGGEEFVVVMPNTKIDSAFKVAEKIRTKLEKVRFHYNDLDLDVTISCGLSEVRPGDEVASLFKRADDALYQAKNAGRNRCVSADAIE